MAFRNTAKTEAVIAKRLREGRGQGREADYKPWLDVQQVPSLGLSERIKGWKSNRVHHLFSQLEVNYFYALEWSVCVTDILKQYPQRPLDETLDIAQACGFTHPESAVARVRAPASLSDESTHCDDYRFFSHR